MADNQSQQPVTVVINNTNTNTNLAGDGSYGLQRKSKWTAFFLCLFLGWIGAHNYYTGKIGLGILYTLTVGLVGIGWIVDIFRILLGTFTDKNGLKLR